MKKIRKILVANRGEIAIRVMRAAAELGIRIVAVYAKEDRFALHRFSADESYLIGADKGPVQAYLDQADILRVARAAQVDAIHPGYGFLSENPDFAENCSRQNVIFIGPSPEVMRTLGNKVAARQAAIAAEVPVVPATNALPPSIEQARILASALGYPLMLKASWGGGGRGMRVVENEGELQGAIEAARREAAAAFGNDEIYLEKLVRRARHVEVQILGDTHGNLIHLFERDCSVQRRNQKVVERAPAPYLEEETRSGLCAAALRLCRSVSYTHAGTVEFLMDADSGEFFFIEVNPRIQVEHTVTEQVSGVDLVQAQILVSQNGIIGRTEGLPRQEDIHLHGHALQCRITTENPENHFTPDYGKLTAYRSAAGAGIRLDAGTAYTGAVITPYYDSLLVKVTAWGRTPDQAARRMDRALREFRIRGVATNLAFLENVVCHPLFRSGACTTRFLDETPALFQFPRRRDRASRLLRFIGDVTVNGHPEMKDRGLPSLPFAPLMAPNFDTGVQLPEGSRDRLKQLGAHGFVRWLRHQDHLLLTDTSMRDAHQSLFATRMRTADMLPVAPYYARELADLFSLECWGGATFDVALRFLREDPWARLTKLRNAVPNILFQMLLRASNAVGYANYPDNVVKYFVRQAAREGIDLFRVFDSLNAVDNMRVAMDAVLESGALCEGTVCYTGDLFDSARSKYALHYYVDLAKQLEKAGAHILGIKDMAGICRPAAIRTLVETLRSEVNLPLHFHTHDTGGASIASVLAAAEAGVDIVDGAMDALSGLTSQPSLGAIVAALADTPRTPTVSLAAIQPASAYWEGVRRYYAPFEADIRAGTSDVYRHEMPGGQYTNLREQARALGLEQRWDEVAQAYADVNRLFGDIVKVTPTSKVVGDMALFMVVNDLTPEQVADPQTEIDFPASVVSLFRGEMGFPPEGFPAALAAKVLKGQTPLTGRAGALLPPEDLEKARSAAEKAVGHALSERELASWLMYPKVYKEFAAHQKKYGDVSVLPTPVFFYGLPEREEIAVDIDPGKTLLIRLLGHSDGEDAGEKRLFFELNGQSRPVRVQKAEHAVKKRKRPAADENNPDHLAAPMPGVIAVVPARQGQKVKKGSPLLSIEAMKMETQITAPRDGIVGRILVAPGDQVEPKDLLLEMQ